MKVRGLVMVVLLGTLFACDDDNPVAPDPGTLEVAVATTGEGTDDDGYTISVDEGAETQDVDVSGQASLELDPGQHTVELTGVAANCTVDGDNPTTVTVESGQSVSVDFAVTCAAAG